MNIEDGEKKSQSTGERKKRRKWVTAAPLTLVCVEISWPGAVCNPPSFSAAPPPAQKNNLWKVRRSRAKDAAPTGQTVSWLLQFESEGSLLPVSPVASVIRASVLDKFKLHSA